MISGQVPQGVVVSYENNAATSIGEYLATAVLTGAGYHTLTLHATLYITARQFVDLNFESKTFLYDGTEKALALEGTLPPEASVIFSNHAAINAGEYNATATISASGYETVVLNATLTIEKSNIEGVVFENKTFTFDGTQKELMVEGALPSGVSVQYTNHVATQEGTYEATAVLSGTNYNTLTLHATLKINPDFSGMALEVFGALFTPPNPWEFLPESFALENKVYTGPTQIDFNSNFVSVIGIPKTGFGKQMNVVYENLVNMQSVMNYLSAFYGYANVMIDAYQSFLNNDPDNYKVFELQTEHFDVWLELTTETNKLLARFVSVAIELEFDKTEEIARGRIELSSSNALKFHFSQNELKLALSILGVAVSQIEFVKEEEMVTGTFYEFYGTEQTNIKTTALIKIDENYTTVVSNKREDDDLIIEGYLETYDNASGHLVGAEVKETNNFVQYDTLWFYIWDIEGFQSIKKEDTSNDLNMDTIYVNNSPNWFVAKRNNFGLGSRQYDIEMKVMYFYTYDSLTNSYSKISMELPMLFVQKVNLVDYETTIYNQNFDNGISDVLENTLTQDQLDAITENYTALIDEFVAKKQLISCAEILNYIGQKNAYFVEG